MFREENQTTFHSCAIKSTSNLTELFRFYFIAFRFDSEKKETMNQNHKSPQTRTKANVVLF